MAYTPPYPDGWRDLPNESTEIDARALDIMDKGIADAHAAIGSGGASTGATGILFVFFNEVSKNWPARSSVTSSPLQIVEWVGNAQPPTDAVGGVDRWFGPLAGSGVTPEDSTPPPVFPDPVTGVSMTAPSGSVSGSVISLSASLTTTSSTTFAFAQIAVRGPAGQKIDTSFHPNVTVDGTLVMTGSITATAPGTWTAFATHNITGGADQASWVDGPATTFTVTAPTPTPTTPGGVPLIGISGLAWNSGTFQGGRSASDMTSFGTWRGRPLDAFLTFSDRWSWAGMFEIQADWPAWPGVIIISTPPQPDGQNCAATAAGTNDQRWRDYGSALTAAGLNTDKFIVRVWEVNGSWYSWSLTNNSEATFIAAMKRMSTALKSTAPNVKISLNWNRGYSGWGGSWENVTEALIGSGPSGRYIDVVGIDSYDWYPAQNNLSNWNNAQGQYPSMSAMATWVRARGLQMSLEEWALISASGGSGGGAVGDDPYYIGKMWDFFVDNADVIAYEGYYNHDGAPSTLQHVITSGVYPNAAAAYRSSTRWGS